MGYSDFAIPMDKQLAVDKLNASNDKTIGHNHNGEEGMGGAIPGSAIVGAVKDSDKLGGLTLTQLQNMFYPIGSYYYNENISTNPATLMGFGTWIPVKGRVPVGVDPNDSDFNTAGKIGGEKTHKLTTVEIPRHDHPSHGVFNFTSGNNNDGNGYSVYNDNNRTTGSTGGDQPHNNLQPYITVYMWKRTA
jgi:hypothetical protein